jgi:hypothetical protein
MAIPSEKKRKKHDMRHSFDIQGDKTTCSKMGITDKK